jgi:hypothetical protein
VPHTRIHPRLKLDKGLKLRTNGVPFPRAEYLRGRFQGYAAGSIDKVDFSLSIWYIFELGPTKRIFRDSEPGFAVC